MRCIKVICLTLALLILGSCSVSDPGQNAPPADPVSPGEETEQGSYQPPPFESAVFHPDKAAGNDQVLFDFSEAASGYIAVSATSEKRLKLQVIKDEITYTYDVASDGTPSVFPLQNGDGTYHVRMMENVVDKKYAKIYAEDLEVKLKDEFQPFLRPSNYVPYKEDSDCVRKASEFSKQADTAMDVVASVYDLICKGVVYDYQKAENIKSGYLPDPDETLATGKGICFDYASLAAAMLRSQGIPTKVIFGYVSPNDVYHAWNMFYTEETGWVTVSYQVSADSWNRLDLTFSAGGADTNFIGNGDHYADVYCY